MKMDETNTLRDIWRGLRFSIDSLGLDDDAIEELEIHADALHALAWDESPVL